MESPDPGINTSTTVSAWSDVDLGLPDPHRLEHDHVAAGRVHEQRRLERGLAQTAQRAAAGHRADEDPRVQEVVGQADPVAEQRALGEGRGGVDRQHRHRPLPRPLQLGQRGQQGRLAGSRRTGDADDRGAAGVRIHLLDQRPALRVVVLDQRYAAGERSTIAGEEALCKRFVGAGHPRRMMSGAPRESSST